VLQVNTYYPRLAKFLSKKLTAYIALARPFTLMPPVFVGVFLTLATMSFSVETLTRGIYIGLTMAFAQAAGQIVNQVVDKDLDKEIKPYRPIPQGWFSPDEALGLAYLFSLLAIARGFTISVYFGLMTCVMLFFAVFYSLPPLSPRRVNPLLNHLWVSFSRSVVPIMAIMGIDGWKYALLAFIWAFGWQGTKDIPDIIGDRRCGIKTIANTYGIKVLRALSGASTIFYIMLCLYLDIPLFLLLAPLALYGLLKYTDEWRGENTASWAVYYVGLGLIPLLVMIHNLLVYYM
jgi:4-hydroxybenzoate polyprenyltransferase